MTLTPKLEKDFELLHRLCVESGLKNRVEALSRIRAALEEAQARIADLSEQVWEKGENPNWKPPSYSDTEADGVVFCGKCGEKRGGDY